MKENFTLHGTPLFRSKDKIKFYASRIFILTLLVIALPAMDTSSKPTFSDYQEKIAGSDLNIAMKAIAGGTYQRGSTSGEKGRKDDEGPATQVQVDDFWMSSYEVTWDLFQLFLYREIDAIGKKGNDFDLDIDGVSGATMPYVNFNRPGHSVVNVTQYAASTFCKWLSAKTGNFYRLPTEAEWEYACRAGSNTTYNFGNSEADLAEYGWYSKNASNAHPPGEKLPNAWGLYDMHGNVAEWVVDGYAAESYRSFTKDNPVNFPEELYPRVIRGGSWKDEANNLRAAARDYSTKQLKRQDPQFPKSLWWHTDATHIGFRIVRPKTMPSLQEMEKFWGQPIEEY